MVIGAWLHERLFKIADLILCVVLSPPCLQSIMKWTQSDEHPAQTANAGGRRVLKPFEIGWLRRLARGTRTRDSPCPPLSPDGQDHSAVSQWSDLPQELWLMIVDHAVHAATQDVLCGGRTGISRKNGCLSSLALTSRVSFNTCAPILFSTIFVAFERVDAFRQFVREMTYFPQFATRIVFGGSKPQLAFLTTGRLVRPLLPRVAAVLLLSDKPDLRTYPHHFSFPRVSTTTNIQHVTLQQREFSLAGLLSFLSAFSSRPDATLTGIVFTPNPSTRFADVVAWRANELPPYTADPEAGELPFKPVSVWLRPRVSRKREDAGFPGLALEDVPIIARIYQCFRHDFEVFHFGFSWHPDTCAYVLPVVRTPAHECYLVCRRGHVVRL